MRSSFAFFALAMFLSPISAQGPEKKTDFAHDVVPILKARCAKCHTNGT